MRIRMVEKSFYYQTRLVIECKGSIFISITSFFLVTVFFS